LSKKNIKIVFSNRIPAKKDCFKGVMMGNLIEEVFNEDAAFFNNGCFGRTAVGFKSYGIGFCVGGMDVRISRIFTRFLRIF
jgi:hypothetical protein